MVAYRWLRQPRKFVGCFLYVDRTRAPQFRRCAGGVEEHRITSVTISQIVFRDLCIFIRMRKSSTEINDLCIVDLIDSNDLGDGLSFDSNMHWSNQCHIAHPQILIRSHLLDPW